MMHQINPGHVTSLPDGRWGFTLVIDGVEKQAVVPAMSSAHEAKEKMRSMIAEKRAIEEQKRLTP